MNMWMVFLLSGLLVTIGSIVVERGQAGLARAARAAGAKLSSFDREGFGASLGDLSSMHETFRKQAWFGIAVGVGLLIAALGLQHYFPSW